MNPQRLPAPGKVAQAPDQLNEVNKGNRIAQFMISDQAIDEKVR